jgi:hypothetical protein
MAKDLPNFAPFGLKEMRALWKKYRGNLDVERMLLEIQYSRQVIHDIEVYFVAVHKAWREQDVGTLVAIEKMRVLLQEQHSRQGVLANILPPPSSKEPPPEPEPELVD